MVNLFYKDPKSIAAMAIVDDIIHESGCRAFFFGSCLRNWLFGKPITKYSIVTNINLDVLSSKVQQAQLMSHPDLVNFRHTHGTFQLTFYNPETETEIVVYPLQKKRLWHKCRSIVDNIQIDRNESLSPLHIDEADKNVPNHLLLLADGLSRAFTLDAIYYDPMSNELIDLFKGLEDIKYNRLRPIDNRDHPYSSVIKENPDTILRSIALNSRYTLVNDETINLYNESHAKLVAGIPNKVIRKNFNDSLTSCGLENLKYSGILDYFIPEFAYSDSVEATYGELCPNSHAIGKDDIFNHIIMTLDQINEKHLDASLELKLATIFHELSRVTEGHESVATKSAILAKRVLTRLGYEDKLVNKVALIIMYLPYAFTWTFLSDDKQFHILDIAKFAINDICVLAWSKCFAAKGSNNHISLLKRQYLNYKSRLFEKPFFTVPYLKSTFNTKYDCLPEERREECLKLAVWDVRVQQLKRVIIDEYHALNYMTSRHGVTRKEIKLLTDKGPVQAAHGSSKPYIGTWAGQRATKTEQGHWM